MQPLLNRWCRDDKTVGISIADTLPANDKVHLFDSSTIDRWLVTSKPGLLIDMRYMVIRGGVVCTWCSALLPPATPRLLLNFLLLDLLIYGEGHRENVKENLLDNGSGVFLTVSRMAQ